MTENQLYSMSADFFDTSSNSSALKIDLFSFGLNERSPLHQLSVSTSGSIAGVGSNSNSLSGYSPNKSAISFHHSHISPGGISSSGGNSNSNGGLNVMLTNAITIPRSSNNPHQSHHDSYPEDAHPNPSPLLSQQMMSSHQQQLLQQQQQQQLQQHQQQLQQHQQQQQQHQQQQQQHHQQEHERFMVDFSEYGLEALDPASLSPTLLHDVSFTAADSPLNSTLQSMTQGDGSLGVGGGFFGQDPQSPISHSGSNSVVGSVPNDSAVGLLGLAGGVGDSEVPLLGLYEDNVNGNTMWSDIGSANVCTKNELDDDYIFPIDKTEIQSLSDGRYIGVSFDDLLPNAESGSVASAVQNGFFEQFAGDSLTSLMPQKLQSPLQQQQQQSEQQHQRQLQVELQQLHEQQQQQPQQLMQNVAMLSGSSPSPYEFYTSTPNKQKQQQMLAAARFSPGSQSSQSPLQINSVTPPPASASRPPYQQQQQQHMVKSRHMQDLKKDFSMSPDRLTAQLGQSMPNSQILLSGQALSPGSGSSGFGSATGASTSTASGSIRAFQSPEGGAGAAAVSRLSSSAPTHLGLDLWKRREPRQHLLSTGSLAEAESYSSLSTGSVLSPSCQDYSQDDEDDASSDYLSDHYDDFSSDNGSDNEDDGRTSTPSNLSSSKGKERFFWQYNVQAKGPKGKRLVFQSRLEDPHVLNEVTDPVFSPNCSVRGIKHSGKARKGDGNDLTPNPRKLHSIGRELDKLSRTINDMTPVSELPFNVRPKSRKEKNKLASRACRLKKKAQHEANKIKNFGLEIEHRRLLNGIAEIKQALLLKYQKQNSNEISAEIDQQIERSYQQATSGLQIAGSSTDFVNKVLENVKAGVPHGGLDALRNA